MRFSNINPNNSPQHSDPKLSTKQQFFAVKRKHRRLKSSTILTESIQTPPITQKQKSIQATLPTNSIQIHKELESTFGSDHCLQFRSKQPKRKTNIKAKIINGQKVQTESQSEDEIISSNLVEKKPKNKQIYQKLQKLGSEKITYWKIQDFVCLAKVGQGSYSEVFKVLERRSGFVLSLKAIKKQKIRELKLQQNLFRQIKISLFLDHPHIIKLYGFFDDQSYVYLLFELATDQNLYQLLSHHKTTQRQPASIQQTQKYITQLCLAINFMHNHSILHRDIKPQNILLTFSNTIKVCDFGWSIYNPDKSLRATLCGTPLYLAPELIKQNEYNELVDVWATGVLTYELLTNQIPFKIKSVRDLRKVVTEQIRYDKILDEQARQFISFALQKEKQDRKSIGELLKCTFIQQYLQNQHF